MVLADVKCGQSVSIEVIQDEAKASFQSHAILSLEEGLLIEAVRHNSQMVNFKKDVYIIFHVNMDPLPVQFEDVTINAVKYKGETYHMVCTRSEGIEVNRRRCFRVFIGIEGEVQLNTQGENIPIIVKDVSATGFSIVSEKDLSVSEGTMKLVYMDNDMRITLRGVVARTDELENGKFLYACELINMPSNFGGYLTKKQISKRKLEGKAFGKLETGNIDEMRAEDWD